MARPLCCRHISGKPAVSTFKPAGIPVRMLHQVVLTLDEFEAIRLADHEGKYQEQAAEKMKVSRPTFGRIIDSAHSKIAEALIMGKALKIEGGKVYTKPGRNYHCQFCQDAAAGRGIRSIPCPYCRKEDGAAGNT
jgi:predicted DNA-binding protein (UPF0251 family)